MKNKKTNVIELISMKEVTESEKVINEHIYMEGRQEINFDNIML